VVFRLSLAHASFAATTWGSLSCPAEPTSIETTDAGVVDILFDTDSDRPCTADLAPTTHEFPLTRRPHPS